MTIFRWILIIIIIVLTHNIVSGQTVLYSEDFNSYNNGTTQGFGNSPSWTIEHYQYTTDRSPNYFMGVDNNGRFKVQNLANSEASAISYLRIKDIDISSYKNVKITARVPPSMGNMESATDYMYFKISTNGGNSDQFHGNINGSIDEEVSLTVSGLTGTTLQIRVAFSNSGADEIYFVDDIEVVGYNDYPAMWLKANSNMTVRSDNGINWWPDAVLGSGMSTTDNANSGPNFVANAFNFNPAARFDGNDRAYRSIPNTLLNTTDNTCFVVQRFESGQVIMGIGQNDMSNDRRLNFVSSSGNPRFDFPNHSTNDGRLVGTSTMVNIPRIYTLASDNSKNRIYYNGKLHASKNRTSTLTTGSGSWSFYLGSNINSSNYSTTQIAEVVYFNQTLTGNTLDSWYSYLGLKYGMTIGDNGGSFVYRNSQENEIWNGQTNYQYDVAGIARDQGWELDQRISRSLNTSESTAASVTMSTTNNFTASNKDTGRRSLNDGQYLIWGHNNASYNSATNSGDYNRVNRFWKVQNTGAVGNIHFQINLSGFPSATNYHVVIDNDTDLSNGVIGEHELTLSSGSLYTGTVNFPTGTSYFTIAESLLPPTGFWVKADRGITLESGSNEVEIWSDQSGTNNATMYATWNKPYLNGNIANFNPAIQFFGTNDHMDLNRPVQDDFTFAIVVKPNSNGPSGSQWWQGDGIFDGEVAGSGNVDLGGLSIINNKLAFGTSEPDHTIISSNPIYANNIPHIAIATRTSSSGAKALFIDGITDNTGTGGTGSRTQPSGFRIGSLYTNINFYDGYIFEIMSLPSVVSTTERQRIESYFALKYGLRINKNYTASPGTVYNVSSHNNDIAGIGKDGTYGLDQKISTTINTDAATSGNTIIATTNDFTSVNQDVYRKSLNAGSFLVWGHDNGASICFNEGSNP